MLGIFIKEIYMNSFLTFPGLIKQHEDIRIEIANHIQEEDGKPENVECLSLKNHRVHYVINLNMLKKLRYIDFRNNLLTEMIGFETCQFLQELYLCENNIRSIKKIDMLNNLNMVDLRGNRITQFLGNSLNHNLPPNLQRLMIRCNNFVEITQIMKSQNKFQILWVDENKFVSKYRKILKQSFKKKQVDFRDLWMQRY